MKLLYFKLKNCPYCRQADAWLTELRTENPDYASVELDIVDESEQQVLADSYDYYYVPTFFLGREKLHEGAATKAKIKTVLDRAAGK
jgi:glutaredoxin